MPKISARTLQEHRAETIDRLLEAWGELVMTRGYESVSLADVAAKAGLARTAIYNYFPDREAILFAWTEREVERTLDRIRQEIAEAETCAEKLRHFVRLQLESFEEHHLPPAQEVMQFLRPDTYKRFMTHVEPVAEILRGILTEGTQSGEFTAADAEASGPLVMACIGAERAPLAAGSHTVDEATERVTGFLLRALGARKPRSRKR